MCSHADRAMRMQGILDRVADESAGIIPRALSHIFGQSRYDYDKYIISFINRTHVDEFGRGVHGVYVLLADLPGNYPGE